MKRVVIVGGGITGLATAHALEKARPHCEVSLVEAAPRLGGNIVTHGYSGFTIDGGPDSWDAAKPHATRLAKELGLGDELIGTRPDTRKVYIVWKNKLQPVPEGVVLGVPTEWRAFAASELLGLDGKLRAALEPFIPRKTFRGDDDESIAAFMTRRLGSDVCEQIAAPLFGSMFAGDADALSARACVPRLVEAETKVGSLVLAMRAVRAERKSPGAEGDGSDSLSLERGVGDLVTWLAHRLRDAEISTDRAATGVTRLPDGDARGRWAVDTAGGSLFADHVALAVPAHASSRLVRDVDPQLASMLGEITYVSTACVVLAYRKYDIRHPLDAVGFLVPRTEKRPILECTFVSSKWDDRAPAGQALLRVVVGGALAEPFLARDDDALVRLAREQLLDLVGIERKPTFSRVFRFPKGSPQPTVGHLGRMRRIAERVASWPGLHAGGNGLLGTGIPDAVAQGEDIAARIMSEG